MLQCVRVSTTYLYAIKTITYVFVGTVPLGLICETEFQHNNSLSFYTAYVKQASDFVPRV